MTSIADVDFDRDSLDLFTWAEKKTILDVRTQKIALHALTGFAFFASALACYHSLYPPITIGLAAISFCSYLYAQSLIDYRDPHVLSKVRRAAKEMGLSQIVNAHGWQNLFAYEILNEHQFVTAYRAFADTLTFDRIFHLHGQALHHLRKAQRGGAALYFHIPPLSEWKNRFFIETKLFSMSEIQDNFPIAELVVHGVLTNEQAALFEELDLAKREFETQSAIFQQTLEDQIGRHKIALKKAIQEAEVEFMTNPAYLLYKNAETYLFCNFGPVSLRYYLLVKDLESYVDDARATKKSAIAAAQEEYRLASEPIHQERNRRLFEAKRSYEIAIESLNSRYRTISSFSL